MITPIRHWNCFPWHMNQAYSEKERLFQWKIGPLHFKTEIYSYNHGRFHTLNARWSEYAKSLSSSILQFGMLYLMDHEQYAHTDQPFFKQLPWEIHQRVRSVVGIITLEVAWKAYMSRLHTTFLVCSAYNRGSGGKWGVLSFFLRFFLDPQ